MRREEGGEGRDGRMEIEETGSEEVPGKWERRGGREGSSCGLVREERAMEGEKRGAREEQDG